MSESFGPWTMGDDAALLEVVSSANIACGFHAGDPDVMARTMAQAQPGAQLRFRFVTLEEGLAAERAAETTRKGLRAKLDHLVRDPNDIRDLLSYQLISGVTAGHDEET
jgi:hypothetical protein